MPATSATEPKARSRVGGHFYLGNTSNGPLLNITTVLKLVASAASEAEIEAVFVNMKEGQVLQQPLTDMGRPQPPTQLETDNSTAVTLSNKNIKKRRSRPINMRYFWIQDRVPHEYSVMWCPRDNNYGDFMTKHHPPSHVLAETPKYICAPEKLPSAIGTLRRLHCVGVLDPRVRVQ